MSSLPLVRKPRACDGIYDKATGMYCWGARAYQVSCLTHHRAKQFCHAKNHGVRRGVRVGRIGGKVAFLPGEHSAANYVAISKFSAPRHICGTALSIFLHPHFFKCLVQLWKSLARRRCNCGSKWCKLGAQLRLFVFAWPEQLLWLPLQCEN